MDATGTIIAVMQPQGGVSQRTGNTWMRQEYVLEIPAQYPRRISFTLFGEDRIKQFNIQPGEEITVQFDIDAREFNGRWYNDIRAFNIIHGPIAQTVPAATAVGAAPGAAPAAAPFPPQQPAAAAEPFPPAQESGGESTDDLPF